MTPTRTRTRTRMPRCQGNYRHWFAYYGWVGSSSPTCVHGCGTANPRYDATRDIPASVLDRYAVPS